jgi:hypothetical protein
LFISTLICWLLGSALSQSRIKDVERILAHSYKCQTSSLANKSVLIVHVPEESLAVSLKTQLCANKVVAKQYGYVELYWGGSLAEQIEFLAKGVADIVLSKQNVMRALMADSTHNYRPIIGYQNYTAFFISNKEKPQLNKAYFLDKKIGLLDYPISRSGHILPKKAFKNLDIDLDALDIVYASSHSELRDMLASGDIDLISSYWRKDDQKRFSNNYTTPISGEIIGSRWFLKMNDENTDLACELQSVISQIVRLENSSYFDQLENYWQCNSLPYSFIEEGF